VNQKFLVDSGNDTYQLIGHLKDGVLEINGQETPLPF